MVSSWMLGSWCCVCPMSASMNLLFSLPQLPPFLKVPAHGKPDKDTTCSRELDWQKKKKDTLLFLESVRFYFHLKVTNSEGISTRNNGRFCWGCPAWWEGEDHNLGVKKGAGHTGSVLEQTDWAKCWERESLTYLFTLILAFVYAGAAKPDFIFLAEVIHGFAVCPVTWQVLQTVFLTNELSE